MEQGESLPCSDVELNVPVDRKRVRRIFHALGHSEITTRTGFTRHWATRLHTSFWRNGQKSGRRVSYGEKYEPSNTKSVSEMAGPLHANYELECLFREAATSLFWIGLLEEL